MDVVYVESNREILNWNGDLKGMSMENYSDFRDARMDVRVCYDILHDLIQHQEPIGKYEQDNLVEFINSCRSVIELYDEGVKWNIIDKDGRLK